MSDRKTALPILDERASRARGYPVWSLDEWKRHHTLYPPKEALRRKHVRCDLDPPDYEAAKGHRTFPKYLQHLCTECRGDGSPRDPMIVGCRIYSCEVWPYRFGKNPTKVAAGKAQGGGFKPRANGEPAPETTDDPPENAEG